MTRPTTIFPQLSLAVLSSDPPVSSQPSSYHGLLSVVVVLPSVAALCSAPGRPDPRALPIQGPSLDSHAGRAPPPLSPELLPLSLFPPRGRAPPAHPTLHPFLSVPSLRALPSCLTAERDGGARAGHSINMGTGITSILLHEAKYQTPGLKQVSYVGVSFALFRSALMWRGEGKEREGRGALTDRGEWPGPLRAQRRPLPSLPLHLHVRLPPLTSLSSRPPRLIPPRPNPARTTPDPGSARYTLYPTLLRAMLYHPTQSLFLGTFSMGFSTIVNMVALVFGPHGGGSALSPSLPPPLFHFREGSVEGSRLMNGVK